LRQQRGLSRFRIKFTHQAQSGECGVHDQAQAFSREASTKVSMQKRQPLTSVSSKIERPTQALGLWDRSSVPMCPAPASGPRACAPIAPPSCRAGKANCDLTPCRADSSPRASLASQTFFSEYLPSASTGPPVKSGQVATPTLPFVVPLLER
jgi:hypothetical protein